ncbi:MAG: hypothetical protein MK132_21155 [Lentisphaerales bacterium]|nr:hypothetical protein [Lentisphaerales bacterium]
MKKFIILLIVLVPGTQSIAESKDAAAMANTNQSSTVIVNNSIWKDTDGNTVWASLGGHISKFDDTYYWVGTDPRKEDSSNRLYSSKTLGSNTWKYESYVEKRKGGLGKRNCTMIYCPKTKKYVIICKGIGFYQSKGSDVKGPYEYVKKISINKLSKYKKFASGGMSAYQEGDDAYVIISMKNHEMPAPRDIFCLILKLSPDFLNFEKEILWMPTEPQREAFWLFKKDKKYYMTYDGPGGWMGSDCYYRTADQLEGPWSEEKKIGMIPEPKYKEDRSHASQHRYIMNINGQWIYGGDRYPYQEPDSHPPENGQHIICPVIWDGEKPYVIWEDKWDISKYDGNAKLAKAKSHVSEPLKGLPRKTKKKKKN